MSRRVILMMGCAAFVFGLVVYLYRGVPSLPKGQSRVWQHDGRWWSVLPTEDGTWLFRLDADAWSPCLKLLDGADADADVKRAGDLAHVLLFRGPASALVSLRYVPGSPASYELSADHPAPVPINPTASSPAGRAGSRGRP